MTRKRVLRLLVHGLVVALATGGLLRPCDCSRRADVLKCSFAHQACCQQNVSCCAGPDEGGHRCAIWLCPVGPLPALAHGEDCACWLWGPSREEGAFLSLGPVRADVRIRGAAPPVTEWRLTPAALSVFLI